MLVMFEVNPQLRPRQIQVKGLPEGVPLPNQLILGKKVCLVQAVRVNKKLGGNTTIACSTNLAGAFALTNACHLHVNTQNRKWTLGPVLGIYADHVKAAGRPFGEQTNMFEELTTYGMKLGVHVILLSPGANPAVRYDTASRTWVGVPKLKPDIVIRRSGRFSKATAVKARIDLSRFQKFGKLHTLPRQTSNKWNLYRLLAKNPLLQSHLPKTTLCTSGEGLYQEVLSRGDVYIKPPGGAQGVSIYRLRRDGAQIRAQWERRIVPRETERLTNVFDTGTRQVQKMIRSVAECKTFWKSTRLRQVIVQNTVLLPNEEGLRFDFRWLVLSSDNPTVVARVARLGKKQGITTNIHTGGTARPAEEMVKRAVGSERSQDLLDQMDEIAKEVVNTLSRQFGSFAELGIDMALTASGEIFIFEVNPTPGRRMLRQLSPGIRRLSLQSLLEYAVRATGYGT